MYMYAIYAREGAPKRKFRGWIGCEYRDSLSRELTRVPKEGVGEGGRGTMLGYPSRESPRVCNRTISPGSVFRLHK